MSLWQGAREYEVVTLDEQVRASLLSPGPSPLMPDLLWDDGATFFVLTDVDLPSTLVGCTTPVPRALLGERRLEAYPVAGSDQVRA
jgi:hypothetical protein